MSGPPTENDDEEGPPIESYERRIRWEVRIAGEEFDRSTSGVLVSSVLAGVGIGTSTLLIVTMNALAGTGVGQPHSPLLLALLGAAAYGTGFLIVILGRMDLFTEYTTITMLPVFQGRRSVGGLARLWALVYCGNIAGTAVSAVLVSTVAREVGHARPEHFSQAAVRLVEHPWWVILLSGAIAGWLMGVLAWLIAGGRDTISQIVFVLVIAGVLGIAHLHHSISGSVEVLAAVIATEAVTLGGYGHFLLWTTAGNAGGAAVFALSVHHARGMRKKR